MWNFVQPLHSSLVASPQQYSYTCLEPKDTLEYSRIAPSIGIPPLFFFLYVLAVLTGFSKLEKAFSKAGRFRPRIKKSTPQRVPLFS
jgi:hypothetical protein